MNIGTKLLITTDNWFFAPDGQNYRAVYGTVRGVFSDTETLGIKTNAKSTNWYVQIGKMCIAGCQIHYVIEHYGIVNTGITRDDKGEELLPRIYMAD